jgi:protein tyrosine/serine phosphatase
VRSIIRNAQAAAFLALLSTAVLVSAGPRQENTTNSSPAKHSMGTPRKVPGIPNFAEVTPRLYRGGQPDLRGIDALEKIKINIVIDMRGGYNTKEEEALKKRGMQYVAIPWHCPFPKDKSFADFLKVMEQNPGKKVFVHCRLGDDRTGMAIAAYRMAEEGWSADEAMNEMKAFGFTSSHHAICPSLAHYEKSFPKRLKTSPAFEDIQSAKQGK